MLIEQTIGKLYQMKLPGMVESLKEQQQNTDALSLSFEERLGLMVDREWDNKESRRLTRRLQTAKLKQPATVEDIDFTTPRGLDKGILLSLAECDFIKAHHNIIITGATGVGKTYVACALANKACRMGYNALYQRITRLLGAVKLARADGSYPALMRKIERTELLLLDDWGLSTLTADEARDVFDILEDRNHKGSVIVISQVPMADWYETIAAPTIADAILDRLIHNAYKIELRGDSMRKRLSPLTDADH